MALDVNPGSTVGVTITWRNNSLASLAPIFVFGVRNPDDSTDWYDGAEVQSASVGAGQEGTLNVEAVLPGDWGSGAIDARVLVDDDVTVWQSSNVFNVVEGDGDGDGDGNGNILTDILPLMIVVMMMSMIMPMMSEATGAEPKKLPKATTGKEPKLEIVPRGG